MTDSRCTHAAHYYGGPCPYCDIEAHAAGVRRDKRARRVRGVVRFIVPYIIVAVALVALGLLTSAVGAS